MNEERKCSICGKKIKIHIGHKVARRHSGGYFKSDEGKNWSSKWYCNDCWDTYWEMVKKT